MIQTIINAHPLHQVSRIYDKIPKAKVALIALLALGTLVLIADEVKYRKNSGDEESEIRNWKNITRVLNMYRLISR